MHCWNCTSGFVLLGQLSIHTGKVTLLWKTHITSLDLLHNNYLFVVLTLFVIFKWDFILGGVCCVLITCVIFSFPLSGLASDHQFSVEENENSYSGKIHHRHRRHTHSQDTLCHTHTKNSEYCQPEAGLHTSVVCLDATLMLLFMLGAACLSALFVFEVHFEDFEM